MVADNSNLSGWLRLNEFVPSLDRGAGWWKEAAWQLLRIPFFLLPIPVSSAIRVTLLRWFGATIGKNVIIRSGVKIHFPWRLEIGDNTWIGEDVFLLNLDWIRIDHDCCISQQAFLCTGNHEFEDPRFRLDVRPISVHASSWIAARVFVGPGVEIGPGTMLTAGTVATRSIEPYCIARGNPAAIVKHVTSAKNA